MDRRSDIDPLGREPVDLSPLDPRGDPERWERMVAGIMARAALPAAVVIRGPWMALAAWSRPALAAAAAVAALSLVTLRATPRPAEAAPEPAVTVVEALDVPRPMADWIVEGREPRRSDLLVALDEIP